MRILTLHFAAFALVACGSPAEPGPLPPLPAIEGLTAAVDTDPAADVVHVNLVAAPVPVSWVDGGETLAWAFNQMVPGPLIQARVGDTLTVTFRNQLPEPTTIHWHGLRIPDDMDGVPAIQEPIQPGETFTYSFTLPDAGTFWYHPHVRGHEQVERGLQGMLVVHEREPVAVEAERGFVLDDVRVGDSGDWYTFDVDRAHMLQMAGRYGNVLLVNGSSDPIQGTVRPGAAERWRIVNTANARTMSFDVTGADWRVIGVDGGLIAEPYTAERVELPVGRRYELEVIPRSDAEQVQLRVVLQDNTGAWVDYPMFEAGVAGEPGDGLGPDWPLPDPFYAPVGTQSAELVFDGRGGGTNIEWTINGQMWGEHDAVRLTGNTPTRMTIREESGREHPYHLHGQFFRVIERNGWPAEEPGWMDTVLLNGDDTVVLYTPLDNPGRWMTHCHILEHAERGMMTELVVE